MASIDKHGKGYRVRVYYKDEFGKRKSITKTGFRTKTEAKAAAVEIEYGMKNKTIKTSIPTLYDYINEYIATFREGKVSVASVDIDKWSRNRLFSINKYDKETKKKTVIKLYEKNIKLNEVTGTKQQHVINQLIEHGFSRSTIKKTNSLLYRVMEKAKYDGYIHYNPAEQIEYGISNEDKKAEYIPTDMIQPFLDDVRRRNTYHYFLFRFIIETGLRVGEACALTIDDIDRANHIVKVYKSYDQKRDNLGDTKTKHKREVHISRSLSDEVFKLIQLHHANKLAHGNLYENKYNFLFVDEYGRPISRSSIHNTMIYCSGKVLGQDNKMSVHKLRHTHATLLLESGVPMKVIQDRLGHQSMEMTERVYSHVTKTMKGKAQEEYDKYVKTIFK